MRWMQKLRELWDRKDGTSVIELGLILPKFMLILLGAIDFSRAYYLSMEVAGAAHAGATYGIQDMTDTAGMTAAATDDAPDVPGLTITDATYGCECSDGTGSSAQCKTQPSCTYNTVHWVKVTASASYTPVFPWPGIPSTITISQSTTMRSGS